MHLFLTLLQSGSFSYITVYSMCWVFQPGIFFWRKPYLPHQKGGWGKLTLNFLVTQFIVVCPAKGSIVFDKKS